MTITIEATYENGVLKPLTPLALDDHQVVRITLQAPVGVAQRSYGLLVRPGAPLPGESPEQYVLRTAGTLGKWNPAQIHDFAMDPGLEYEPWEDE